jgi:PAS domain S-box-containing protein
MIKLLKPFLVVFFVSLISLSIGNKEDTMLSNLGKASESEKYEIYKNLSQLFYLHDKNTALKYSIKMLEAATTLKNPELTAYSHYCIGLINFELNNMEVSLGMLQNAYEYYLTTGNDTTLGNIFYTMSRQYLVGQMYQKSVETGTKALFYYNKANHLPGIAASYMAFGQLFERLRDYPKAIQLYKIAESYIKNYPDKKEYINLKLSLASCYIDSDSIPKGKKLLDEFLLQLTKAGKKAEMMKCYSLVGNYYIRINKNDSAIYYYNEAIALSNMINDASFKGTTYTKIGHVYSLSKNWTKTLEYNKLALEEREKAGVKSLLASSYLNLAGNYTELNEYENAEGCIKKGLQYAKESNSRTFILLSYQKYAQLYSKMGKFSLAYSNLQEHIALNDSALLENEKKISLTLFNDYERETQRLITESKNNSRISLFHSLAFGLVIVCLIAIFALLYIRYKEKKKRQISTANEIHSTKDLQVQLNDVHNKLKISEEKYRVLTEAAAAGIGIVDDNESFIFVNAALCAMLGYGEAELLEKNLAELSPIREFDRFKDQTTSRRTGITSNYETQLVKKTGNIIDVHVWASPLYDNSGQFYGTLGIVIDLTPNKKVLDELLQAKLKAEESEKLKASFLANMSHEVRTPINAIIGGVYLLQNDSMRADEQLELQNHIVRNATNLLDLWENIITITRLNSGQIENHKSWFKVQPYLAKLANSWKSKIPPEKASKLSIELCNESNVNQTLSIYCDESNLSKVFDSLLSNAIKFTDEGHISICYRLDNNIITFKVTDTGIGLNEEQKSIIFERFRQAREGMARKYGGAGLGLSIAKGMVETMGGTISVSSEIGKGAAFSFTIPDFINIATDIDQKTVATITYPNWFDKTILIVEDVETNYQFLEALLKKSNVKTVWAQNGLEAVELCRNKTHFDLILMDMQMPIMNGIIATKEIRSFDKNIVIIAQTAYGMVHDRQKALDAGCNDYIMKPIRIKNLNDVLKTYLGAGS